MGLFAALCVRFSALVKGLMLDDTFRRFVLAGAVGVQLVCRRRRRTAALADRNKRFFSAYADTARPALVYAVRLVAAMLWRWF